MTDREAKIEALRLATASLNAAVATDFEGMPEDDIEKVCQHLKRLAKAMYKRAEKMGGGFNPYLGY